MKLCQAAVEGHLYRDEAETVLAAVADAIQKLRLRRKALFGLSFPYLQRFW